MHYTCELDSGQHLHVANEGDQTSVNLSSGSSGQQQSQGSSFTTGRWSKAPALFRLKNDVILQVHTSEGDRFLRVRGSGIQSVKSAPDLDKAEKLPLKKSSEPPPRKMQPMRPMEPMKPMKPMEPMRPMRPMEMRMGDMQMSMGSSQESGSGKRFCSQCGKQLGRIDRFCSHCGHEVGK